MMNGIPVFLFADEAKAFGRSYYLSYKLIQKEFTKEKFDSKLPDHAFQAIKSQTLYDLSVMSHISLYHFWEYQTRRLLRILYKDRTIDFSGILDLERKLKSKNVSISIKNDCPDLFELELVCNTLKHGMGWSESELRKLNSGIFIRQDPNTIFAPMISKQLAIDPLSYRKYLKAITMFWELIAFS